MNPKAEYLIDLIFKKLKNYKAKEIFLEKENFHQSEFMIFRLSAHPSGSSQFQKVIHLYH